ncbi:MAG: CDP-diacylglycerol--glycerol-3-phosphate 3-phosphatidyltransferase [Methylobacillus sp.]|jgi:CDP-diacylglycerol--glycerol-3-phosphate 3-phosphatidyltransferase/cardiolipin synthase|nr:CDP-diacylglycerol--glycerol-3-phosphate 3-phosphatidyltransferase [Methylobacillus sp.]
MNWNIPNILTWLRILSIPLFVGVFYCPESGLPEQTRNLYATLIFAFAALTDWLDGYLARALNQTSSFGAFLDPVADKLMVAAALIVLVEFDRVGAVVAVIIIGREIAISALREWMAGLGKRQSVAVAFLGKIKTTSQMIAILFLLYYQPIAMMDVPRIGSWLMYLAAALTLISMANYLKIAWPQIRER